MAKQLKPKSIFGTYSRVLLAMDMSVINDILAETSQKPSTKVAFGGAFIRLLDEAEVQAAYANPLRAYANRDIGAGVDTIVTRRALQQMHEHASQQELKIEEAGRDLGKKIASAQIDPETSAPLQSKLKSDVQSVGKTIQSIEQLTDQTHTLLAELNQLTAKHNDSWKAHNEKTLLALIDALEQTGIQLPENERAELLQPKVATEIAADFRSLPLYQQNEKYRNEVEKILENIEVDRANYLRAKAWYVVTMNKLQSSLTTVDVNDINEIKKIIEKKPVMTVIKDDTAKQLQTMQQQERQVILDQIKLIQKESQAIEKDMEKRDNELKQVIKGHDIKVPSEENLREQAEAREEAASTYHR